MQMILSHVRRCVEDYGMIRPGDRIAVGVSGGKDSLALLYAMAKLKTFYPAPFELHAITVHPARRGWTSPRWRSCAASLECPTT